MGIYLSKDGISYLWAKIKNKFYTKPSGGIPKSDLASSVQASLSKADSALQSHQDISGKQDKLTAGTNITISGNTISAKDTTYGNASASVAGLMTAADKKKLDGMDLSKYLPLAGGMMSGNIDMMTNVVEVRVSDGPPKSTPDRTLPMSGVISGTSGGTQTDLPKKRSFIGSYSELNGKWNNMISVRHRNGYNDGTSFGMYMRSVLTEGGSIIWNKQTAASTWQGERVLLDSTNYSSYAADKNHTHQYIPWIKMGGSGTNALYGIFASMSDTNPLGNSGATLLVTDVGDFASGQTGAWIVQISNRSNKPWMIVTTLIPHESGTVNFGYYHDTTNKLFYFGAYTTAYRSTFSVSVLRSGDVTIKNFGSSTSTPSGWTAVKSAYDITHSALSDVANTLTDSGWLTPTTTGTSNSTLRYRKQGKIVCISGYVQPSAAGATITPFTLPTGYRPPQNIKIAQAVDSSLQDTYIVTIYTNGNVTYSGKKQGFFTTGSSYYMHVTYFID